MCPLWPIHLLLLYLMILCPLWLLCSGAVAMAVQTWDGSFDPANVKQLEELQVREVLFLPAPLNFKPDVIEVISADKQIAEVTENQTIYMNSSVETIFQNFSFALTGRFLGHTEVKVRATNRQTNEVAETDPLPISVIRKETTMDKIFVISVALLVALNSINMGCTLDLQVVKTTLRRPIAPAVGLVSQYLFMPVIAFGISYAIFDTANMRLGLFTVGCSPGGGASNIWTILLGGNLNLSITMTFISNVIALVMMPAWLFTLGGVIFSSSKIKIPYTNIVTSLVAIVLPVGIGLLMQRYLPRAAKLCKKIVRPSSLFIILFIIIFGIIANLYMFALFDWKIIVAGMGVPWFGYMFGALAAYLFRFPVADIIAVCVETGIQNTGIAIILLRFSLPQPDADLTSVIPVASAIMMPFPLLTIMIVMRIRKWMRGDSVKPYDSYNDKNGDLNASNVKHENNSDEALMTGNGEIRF